jgi:GNAT superfamily N-acetyltransferase
MRSTESTNTDVSVVTREIQTRIPELTLQFAQETDTELILELIRTLAEFEKLAHEVAADVEILRRSLFGSRRVAEVLIAEYGGATAGFTLFFHNFSTFLGKPGIYLEDLFIKPEFRGKGIGREVLAFLARLAVERDCGRLEWAVLDWNTRAIDFYKRLGAQPMDDWTVFRLTGKELHELAGRF